MFLTKCEAEFCTFACNESSYSKYLALFLPNMNNTYCSSGINMAWLWYEPFCLWSLQTIIKSSFTKTAYTLRKKKKKD